MATQTTAAKSAFETFLEYRKTEATRISYAPGIRGILGENPDAFLKMAKRDQRKAEEHLMSYVIRRRGTLSSNSLSVYLAQAKSFLEFNEVTLNWKKIRSGAPSASHVALDRPPTTEEIRKALKDARPRERLAILVMASGGVRVGAFAFLTVGDLVPLESGIGALTVYRGEPEEYRTFVSRECVQAFLEYVEARKTLAHEEVTGASPLIRTVWKTQTDASIGSPRDALAVDVGCIQSELHRLWIKAGVRVNEHEGSKRKAFKGCHGFRKFAKTQLSKAGLSWEDSEVMLGHRLNYYKPSPEHLEAEYLKAEPIITIGEEFQLKQTLATTEEKHTQAYTGTRLELLELRETSRQQQEAMRDMQAQMTQLIAAIAERDRRKSEAAPG